MTSFIDKARIHVKSGAGGNGMVAWRREKYVPQGGPAGGDGGRGGDVIIEATDSLNTLLEFRYKSIFKGEDGEKGKSKNMHGKSGRDLLVLVPCGTIVRDSETGDAIADLTLPGQRVVVAAGGRGGRGNSRFLSSKRQAPQFSEPGEPGIERELDLELKLLADVGIIGLPNAGKSTLISVISAAKPKIADYPFTTLVPNLGVVRDPDGDGIVVADIPGLVEGASDGVGLGHEFLRHVERTRLLLHLVDMSQEEHEGVKSPLENFALINDELARYSPKLAKKTQIIVLTKKDAVDADTLAEQKKLFEKQKKGDVYVISSVTRDGLDKLLTTMFQKLQELEPEDEIVDVVADYKAFDNDDSAYEVHRKGKNLYVTGGKIDRLFNVTDMRNRAAVHRLMNILKAMGVDKALVKAGAKEGDVVHIAGLEFDYIPDGEDMPVHKEH